MNLNKLKRAELLKMAVEAKYRLWTFTGNQQPKNHILNILAKRTKPSLIAEINSFVIRGGRLETL